MSLCWGSAPSRTRSTTPSPSESMPVVSQSSQSPSPSESLLIRSTAMRSLKSLSPRSGWSSQASRNTPGRSRGGAQMVIAVRVTGGIRGPGEFTGVVRVRLGAEVQHENRSRSEGLNAAGPGIGIELDAASSLRVVFAQNVCARETARGLELAAGESHGDTGRRHESVFRNCASEE